MTEEKPRRKLSAILSADVKGYSRLMEENEEETVRTITSYRKSIVSLVQDHHGRVVDAKGDNVLAEFLSVVDAVRCAVEVQNELKQRNSELPDHRRMEFRIGINLGDVIDEEGSIYGDGVNVAARLEGLAEVGGICISGTVYDHVETKLGLEFDYLGEQPVKNIKRPVRVYRVKMDDVSTNFPLDKTPSLPDKPSVAVLPFENMSDDPKQEYFSDGITEEIITALSKIPRIFVIARHSSFKYKGRPLGIPAIGRELGVRYVLEGSVRRSGDKVRVTAQLIDAQTDHHMWSERYDRDLKEVFAVQDEITRRIITALQVELTEGEEARLHGEATENLEAYLKMLQARHHFYRMNRQGSVQARKLAEEAIQLDPGYASSYVMISLTHMMDLWFNFSNSPEKSMKLATEASENALSLDDANPSSYVGLCMLYVMQRRHDEAITAGKRAIELSPSGATAHMSLGTALSIAGKQEESIAAFETALRLNPYPHSVYFRGLGNSYRLAGDYEMALTEYRKALQFEPEDLFTRLGLAATYVSLGRQEEAEAEAAEILRIHPEFSLEYFGKTLPFKNDKDTRQFVEALRRAGLK